MNFQEELNKVRTLLNENEELKEKLDKTAKAVIPELVSYEGIDSLIAALMGFYNGELKTKAPSSHTHDDRYYTESEINTKLNGKANTSHGHHVPAVQTASNKVFLRNDNTWATITPANIGAQAAGSYAASSHTHDDRYYTESEINTKLNGKANTSHGHHVPAVQTASNKVFLRNDNTWATITPANIGAQAAGSYAASSHTHDDRYYTESEINTKLNGKANTSGNYPNLYPTLIQATYTGNGGKQPPSYIPKGKIRFNMTNDSINGHSGCKDWMFMDTYGTGSDVPRVTAFGIARDTKTRAFLMVGPQGGSAWDHSSEIWTTYNMPAPIPVGGILLMYNTSNPATLYPGTTWELLASDKYIRTTTGTPLATGGSNSVSIAKANLPNTKLKVDAHTHTQPAHTHTLHIAGCYHQYADDGNISIHVDNTVNGEKEMEATKNYAKAAGGENTGSSASYTEALGSGTALSINPAYITLRFWKRLT